MIELGVCVCVCVCVCKGSFAVQEKKKKASAPCVPEAALMMPSCPLLSLCVTWT